MSACGVCGFVHEHSVPPPGLPCVIALQAALAEARERLVDRFVMAAVVSGFRQTPEDVYSYALALAEHRKKLIREGLI